MKKEKITIDILFEGDQMGMNANYEGKFLTQAQLFQVYGNLFFSSMHTYGVSVQDQAKIAISLLNQVNGSDNNEFNA